MIDWESHRQQFDAISSAALVCVQIYQYSSDISLIIRNFLRFLSVDFAPQFCTTEFDVLAVQVRPARIAWRMHTLSDSPSRYSEWNT